MQLSSRARQASWETMGTSPPLVRAWPRWSASAQPAFASSWGPCVRLSLSLSCLEDAGWTLKIARVGQKLRRGQEEIEILRRDGVYWIRVMLYDVDIDAHAQSSGWTDMRAICHGTPTWKLASDRGHGAR